LKQANEVEKLDPQRGHLLRANYYQRNKDFDHAEEEYKKSIEADPQKSPDTNHSVISISRKGSSNKPYLNSKIC